MKVHTKEGTFDVWWSYKNRPSVNCVIAQGTKNSWSKYFSGVALLSKQDRFVRETGRKVSLARALKVGGFDREARREFWVAYLGRKGRIITLNV